MFNPTPCTTSVYPQFFTNVLFSDKFNIIFAICQTVDVLTSLVYHIIFKNVY